MSDETEQLALSMVDQSDQQLEDREYGPVVYHDHIPEGVVMYRLGGRMYPMKFEPQCSVCQSPHRLKIEREVLEGYSYRSIHSGLDEEGRMHWTSIQRHVSRGHLPVDAQVKRFAIEERARELGRSAETHDQALADHVTMARLGVQKVFEKMMRGDLEPDIQDGIAFGNMLMKLGMYEGSDIDRQAMMEAFTAYMEAAEEVMNSDQMRTFGQLLSSNSTLRALMGRTESGPEEPPIDVEVERDEVVIEQDETIPPS